MILTEKEINNMPVNSGTLWIIKKSHIEALDKIKELDPYYYISKWEYYEDRADQLAVIADALAVCCDPEYLDWWMDRCLEQAARAARAEAKLRELAEAAAWRDECFRSLGDWPFYNFSVEPTKKDLDRAMNADSEFSHTFDKAEAAYQAALKAAKEGK